jgi:hypothetical protein
MLESGGNKKGRERDMLTSARANVGKHETRDNSREPSIGTSK